MLFADAKSSDSFHEAVADRRSQASYFQIIVSKIEAKAPRKRPKAHWNGGFECTKDHDHVPGNDQMPNNE